MMVYHRRRLVAALSVIALVALTASIAQVSAKPRRPCPKSFSLAQFQRAADLAYRGTANPPRGTYRNLWYYARCQRPPGSERVARELWEIAHNAWAQRRQQGRLVALPLPPLAVCILYAESRSIWPRLNTQASNGTHFGAAQWSKSAWIAMGGSKFAATPLGATGPEQVHVLEVALAHGEASQWTCCDPCG